MGSRMIQDGLVGSINRLADGFPWVVSEILSQEFKYSLYSNVRGRSAPNMASHAIAHHNDTAIGRIGLAEIVLVGGAFFPDIGCANNKAILAIVFCIILHVNSGLGKAEEWQGIQTLSVQAQ